MRALNSYITTEVMKKLNRIRDQMFCVFVFIAYLCPLYE